MKVMRSFSIRSYSVLKKVIVLSIVSMFISFFQGCYFLPKEEEILAPPLKSVEEVQYKTIKVEKGTIEKKINATAYFISDLQTDVSFESRGGRIEYIYVKTGDMVKKGDVLIQLEKETLENQIFQQKVSLEKLKLNYNQTISNMERSIELFQMQLEEYKQKLNELKNQIEGVSMGLSVESIMPSALKEAEDLEIQVKKQEIALQGEIEKYNITKDLMELDIKTQELQLENLNLELEKTRITAPVPGQVVWISSVKEGDYVYAHSNLVRIADVNKLKLKYAGDNLSEFNPGDKVDVEINGNIYIGEVVMTPANAPFDADESIKKSVLIDVKNLPDDVSLGDSARISLLIERKENVIVIPRNLLHSYMGQNTVYVLEDGIKTDRNVQIGIETPTEVEIVSGLNEGEEIIAW